MTDTPSYRFSEQQAAQIVSRLHQCVELLNETVGIAQAECPEDVVRPYKLKIAGIMADLGWEVLEQGFYKKYPRLRPEGSVLRTDPPP
jgi:hypothetical protein